MTDRYAKYRTVETDERKRKYIGWIEELSLNAWPSHKIELYDGWLLRFSHNYTHRTNSVQQVGESKIPLDEKIRYCESVYHAMHTPCIFKLSPLTDTSFDQLLENRVYTVQHQTETMVLDCRDFRPREAADVEYEFYGRNSGLPSIVGYPGNVVVQLRDRITDEWMTGLFRLNGTTSPTLRRIVPSMYHAIPKETIVARVDVNGGMVASGLAILDRGYCGIYAIYVDPAMRRKHIASWVVNTLLSEAQKKGCRRAYLQCVRGNTGARAMYEEFGFQHLYDYWFRGEENFRKEN